MPRRNSAFNSTERSHESPTAKYSQELPPISLKAMEGALQVSDTLESLVILITLSKLICSGATFFGSLEFIALLRIASYFDINLEFSLCSAQFLKLLLHTLPPTLV